MYANTSPDPARLNISALYTRDDAITDGLLIPVPPTLVKLYRLPWQIAVTANAWNDTVAWPAGAPTHEGRHHRECEEGRLFDLLWMITTIQHSTPIGRRQPFTVWRIPPTKPRKRSRPVRLTLTVHIDGGKHVATVAHRPQHGRHWWRTRSLTAASLITVALFGAPMFVLLRAGH